MSEFEAFPKMARLSRHVVITEKIDGTNAQVFIADDGAMKFGSRTRWITPEDDNFGFAAWAHDNREELLKLGPGRHFGEWWGKDIQRNYGLLERRFSLFNSDRWDIERPTCCHVVPVLHEGMFDMSAIEIILSSLSVHGSRAAPDFINPEGIVVFHSAANISFKKTLKKDELPKSMA